MHAHVANNDRSSRICASLDQETAALEAINRGFSQRVAAWRLAHETAVAHATSLLARMDTLMVKLQAR
jgi:hypothetical protein